MVGELKELVTAALPYANGDLHIGHLMSTYLPADVYSRYCRLAGRETLFVCATDEHGTPIEFKAEKEGVKPQEFVKHYHARHEEDFRKFRVEFDSFHSTDAPENHELTKEFYEAIDAKGLFYEAPVKQNYCPKCERVLPDRYVKGDCPYCGAPEQYGDACEKCGKTYSTHELKGARCAVCASKPTMHESRHLFFKLSSFGQFFKEWFAEAGLQKDVVNYVENWLADLKDWDVTRDGPYFGVPIPGRENQFFYVWFDAPIGYVASTKAWCDRHSSRIDSWWKNRDCRISHFIGKDIVYHHYLFWPAMLKSAGYSLPSRIPTRGHLNVNGEKMSKSRGTFILLRDLNISSDYLRYYLTAITPNSTADINYSEEELKEKVNKELVDAYGNLVNRCLSFIKNKLAEGKVPEKGGGTEADEAFEKSIASFLAEAAVAYDAVELKRALESCMAFAGKANKYFNDRQPWKLLKENPAEAEAVLHNSAKAVYALSVALSPVIPDASAAALEMLGCAPRWSANAFEAKALGDVKPLFQKLE